MIDKRHACPLKFTAYFFEHDPNDPIPVHLADKHLTGKRTKLTFGMVPQRLGWGVGYDSLRKKHCRYGTHFIQPIDRFVKWVAILPILLPHQTRRMAVEMTLSDVEQRTC